MMNEAPDTHLNELDAKIGGKVQPLARLRPYNFWVKRNEKEFVWLNRFTSNLVSVVLAYTGYEFGVTPNQLSILSATCAVMAFLASLFLSVDQPNISVIVLYIFAQLSYAFDCADGLLARVTNAESKFGEFLDKCIDIATGMLCVGAVFGYVFRHYLARDQTDLAGIVLLSGFLFIIARSSRHFAQNKFHHMYQKIDFSTSSGRSFIWKTLVSLMDSQASIFAIFLFLISPWSGIAFYSFQTLILAIVYVRYFRRAYLLDKSVSP